MESSLKAAPPDTPLMRQYAELKASHPNAVLFFRLGDFYEMFFDDARLAAPILGLVLTQRQGIPMCGVPCHSHEGYLARLLKAGHKVAVAEQMEDPSQTKKLVSRKVVRVATPGTLVEDELLEPSLRSVLCAVEVDTVGWGLGYLDISSGEFWATQALNDEGFRRLDDLLGRIRPAEILAASEAVQAARLAESAGSRICITTTGSRSRAPHPPSWAKEPSWLSRPLALKAALKCRNYALETQLNLDDSLLAASYKEPGGNMSLDENAARTLELVESSSQTREGSLLSHLARTATSMGARRMRDWIIEPSVDLPEIERRLDCVEALVSSPELRNSLFGFLREAADLPRICGRLMARQNKPRDLAALRATLGSSSGLDALLKKESRAGAEFSGLPADISAALEALRPLGEFLSRAIAENPPAKLSEGGLIREGYSPELDALRRIKTDANSVLERLEASERQATGIPTLKAGYNSVFGYYFEATKAHSAKVPGRFLRKQTLANAERFITPELKELEAQILGADGKIIRLERELFEAARERALGFYAAILALARALSELDVFCALAATASLHGYVRPSVDLSHDIEIEEGRHPALEAMLPAGSFVPNSLSLSCMGERIVILTGPNMSGKSTFLRQNALIVLMAQMGSFVPARRARIGIVDKIMTRIGAQDALSRGESTFMVEMKETAKIIASAGPRSLLVLDEIGRGTSTFDGVSIAWAVLEHLQGAYGGNSGPEAPRGPRVLFATHYFELTELAATLEGVVNLNVDVREWTDPSGKREVVFLHKIASGPADRSYGVHVAALAGLPGAVIDRANKILERLEDSSALGRVAGEGSGHAAGPRLPIFAEHPVLSDLRLLDVKSLGPAEAVEALSRLKEKLHWDESKS